MSEGAGRTRDRGSDDAGDRLVQLPEGVAPPLCSPEELASVIAGLGTVTVLTGAGISTDSGIPDYRDDAGRRKGAEPMKFQAFRDDQAARQRYWARSWVGLERFGNAVPNAAHRSLAELEGLGKLGLLITQNVDRLHQKAGHQRVLDLHGRLDVIRCLACGAEGDRYEYQRELSAANPAFAFALDRVAPDGDAELREVDYSRFQVVPCGRCGGILKPDVVFFGETVPPERVAVAMSALRSSDALLVVGTSLIVMSGYRFARSAARLGLPVLIVNRGRTRADVLAKWKLEASVGLALPALVEAVGVLAGRGQGSRTSRPAKM